MFHGKKDCVHACLDLVASVYSHKNEGVVWQKEHTMAGDNGKSWFHSVSATLFHVCRFLTTLYLFAFR
jgi:hypothetical protein